MSLAITYAEPVAPPLLPTGFRHHVPFDEYRRIQATNISSLKNLARSPRHYRHELANPKESPALALGTAAHTAVLEPHRFLREYALWDERTESGAVRPRRGKDWEAFAAVNATKRIVKADEYDTAQAIRDAVRACPDAMRYLARGTAEVTILWQDPETGRQCKGRADWLTEVGSVPVVVGLKTTRDCRQLQFGNQAAKLGYHLQWAFYCDGYEAATGRIPLVAEVVAESAAPHDVAVYRIPDDILEQGRDEYRRLLHVLIECERSDDWPGAVTGEQILTLPSWAYRAEDDISDLALEATS